MLRPELITRLALIAASANRDRMGIWKIVPLAVLLCGGILVSGGILTCGALISSCSPRALNEDEPGSVPSVRVCIADYASTVSVRVEQGAVIESIRGAYTMSAPSRLMVSLDKDGAMQVNAGGRDFGHIEGVFRCYHRRSGSLFDLEGRTYPDTLMFASDGERMYVVNILPVERYLMSVVPNEIGRNRKADELEALKAQAVIARTYTMMKIDLPLRRLFDVYADTRDQVYTGMGTRTDLTDQAVHETEGQVLIYNGAYAECFFHSTCGGATEAVAHVWRRPQSKPYLTGIRDRGADNDYCSISPSYRWSEYYTRRDLESLLRTYLPSADDSISPTDIPDAEWSLSDLRILARAPSGRVQRLKIVMAREGRKKEFLLEGDRIRWALRRTDASSILRSTLFDVYIERDAQRTIRTIRIDGGGNGHGIGLCQWGAIARARAGFTTAAILQSYFPATTLARNW